jgi:hypothetical protein
MSRSRGGSAEIDQWLLPDIVHRAQQARRQSHHYRPFAQVQHAGHADGFAIRGSGQLP